MSLQIRSATDLDGAAWDEFVERAPEATFFHRWGWRQVIDEAFGHDLKYEDAVPMLTNLRAVAQECGLEFGVKLSNTLEVENQRTVFDPAEKTMYLSGRPLHAITVNLASKLDDEFDGDLLMSFSAGANCF